VLSIKLFSFAAEIAAAKVMMTSEALMAPGVRMRTQQKIKVRNPSPLQRR